MYSKRKSKISNLVAIVVFLIIALCFVCGFTYGTAESSVAQLSDEVDIVATSNTYEDFSSYTNQELPDKIDKNNIKQYVPVDKFNTDRYVIHNGRNYGFIIFNDSKTNHVLLFKETITNPSSYDYEVEFKVLYTNAFFKTGNTILNANSPYNIALSNINFSEFILDAQISENVTDFTDKYGPHFWSAGLDGDISFLDKKNTSDNISINRLDVNSTAKSDKALAYNIADLTIDAVENNVRVASSTLGNNNVSLGFNDYKCIELKVNAGADDFLANKNGKQDYLKASFKLDSIFGKNYYIYNNISFDICLYNALQVKKEVRIASESVFSPTSNSTSEYGILDISDDGYTLKEYYRFEPLLNDYGVFNFAPDKDRIYKIETPDGYYATINNNISNSENVFAVSGQSNMVGFTPDINSHSNQIVHGARLLAQDFIGGEIKFANIGIKREQELKLGNTYLNQEIPTYRTVKMSEVSNNLFALDTTGYAGNINLHILDEDMNVLQSSTRYGKEIVINYPFSVDKKYFIVCDNQSYVAQALQFADKGILEYGDKKYPSVENMYYRYTVPRYTQYYQTFAKQIVDEQMNVIAINNGDVFLESGNTYFLQSGISRLMMNISDSHIHNITKLNERVECIQEYNEAFEFIPRVSAQYVFADGTYDIYRNWTLIAEDVDTIYLNESEIAYQIVKRQKAGDFVLDIQGEELRLGLNNLSQSSTGTKSSYIFKADEKMRIEYTVNPAKNVYIYDSYLNLIEFYHGYPLNEGKNYIFIDSSATPGTITIEEYLQKVNIDLYVDGEKYDYNRDFYYGKDLILPVLVKDRHNFIGWRDSNGLVTDSNGQGLTEISQESMTLTAVWQLRGIVIKVSSNGDFWWNGQAMTKQEVNPVFVDENIDSIYNKVVSLVESTPECIKVGYYNKYYDFKLTSSDEINDYYSLVASTEKEKYRIRFEILGSYYYTNGAVAYGDTIKSANFPQEVLNWSNREYAIVSWRISASSQNVSITSGMTVEDLTPGRGSNNGTLGYSNVYLTANISYVSYKFNINGNLYEIPRTHSYKIETLEDYGYNAGGYYGYNVWFQNSKGEIYYIDDAVFVRDLYDFWTYGKVNVIIDLKIVSKAIKVNINYVGYGDGKQVELIRNNNRTDYQGNGTYTLSSVTTRGWLFDCWKVNNVKITQLSYHNLAVLNYYSQEKTIELQQTVVAQFTADKIENPKSGTIRVETSSKVARIYGNNYGFSDYYTFIIASSMKEVTFVGGVWNNTNIQVEDNNGLTIYFDNVYMKAKNNESVLYSERFIELLYSFGTTQLCAGDVTEKGAQAAIVANENIALGGDKFIICGGNSTDPYLSASYGIKCDNVILSATKVLEVYGGNGASGVYHSTGHGGHGVYAVYADGMTTILKESQIICYGGNGGDARDGTAGNGAVAACFRIEVPTSCLMTCVPGKGGVAQASGGIAGKDGDGGYKLY